VEDSCVYIYIYIYPKEREFFLSSLFTMDHGKALGKTAHRTWSVQSDRSRRTRKKKEASFERLRSCRRRREIVFCSRASDSCRDVDVVVDVVDDDDGIRSLGSDRRRRVIISNGVSVLLFLVTADSDVRTNAFEESDDDDDDDEKIRRASVGGEKGQFRTISEALGVVEKDGLIEIREGRYEERLVIRKDGVKLRGIGGGVVEVVWKTSLPYESVLEIDGGVKNVVASNIKFSHASKSVANNFAVFVKENASLRLENSCAITSETGTGISTEGGEIDLDDVKIERCKNHGVSVFANQMNENKSGKVKMRNVKIFNCGGDGVLLRGSIGVDIKDVEIENCAGFAINAFDEAAGVISVKTSSSCKKGKVGGDPSTTDLEINVIT